jgi:hypothetical protein
MEGRRKSQAFGDWRADKAPAGSSSQETSIDEEWKPDNDAET